MAGRFYQANFCAECGNALAAQRRWWPRYFCDECAARLERGRHTKLLGVLLVVVIISLLAFTGRRTATPINPAATTPPVVSVSALDATARQSLVLNAAKSEASPRVLCGARTRRGTPCRHRVPPGQRCAQHRGKPSMLKSATPGAVLDAPKPVN